MKILLTCDPEITVPPVNYGGIERIVNGLTLGYTNAGHEVFLVANPESTCKHTCQNFKWPALRSQGTLNIIKNMRYLQAVAKKIKPDIVHSFSRLLYGYPLFVSGNIPFVQSYQRKISAASTSFALKLAGHKLRFTSCAAHMLKGLPNRNAFTPIFNFTDVRYFTNDTSLARTHLMFLGRIENIKGTKEAIKAAIQSNSDIIVAGNIQPGHESYFELEIKPLLANPLVHYIGAVNDEKKRYYLQRSKALLFPVMWEEPFGIVLAEALACGTPVIAFDRGSVPEIVNDAINGYIVKNRDDMVVAVNKIDTLDNQQVRADAENRFSLQNITKQYISLFNNIIDCKKIL